ncbi:MAG: hypothetical protein CMJ64_11160 [Planctomycetaceae bacterium]|nr:hypothetical protein [Planctomycetaceae bacterium]
MRGNANASVIVAFDSHFRKSSRKPTIVADATHAILTQNSRKCTGNVFIDEEVLKSEGASDFDLYAMTHGVEPLPSFSF